ncbi:MAG: Hpt domain-containing protein, partial [Casimicrobiaceae bacterium]
QLAPDFAAQVDAMLVRLDAARAGREVAAGATVLDEMSKRAQDRTLVAQVMREVQANLRHMEQVLDAFFRDRSKRAELAGLGHDSQQIRGALRMLDLGDADHLLGMCEKEIESWAQQETPIESEDLEHLAESLSGLGFYVDAVLQQRPGREQMIAPLIAKRLGTAPAAAPGERISVEHSVSELRAALPRLVDEVRAAPNDSAARAELRAKFASLRDDAELIGDPELAEQARAALRDLDAAAAEAALPASVERIADSTAAPAPEISAETRRLLATDAGDLDAELLDIYLTEADEVLDTIDDGHRTLAHNSADREALVRVRRQFHTLKGSGRMVGLTELGEQAWSVERVLNRVLEDDRRVTPGMLELIRIAQISFGKWVAELRTTGRITTDPAALEHALAAVEAALPASPVSPSRAKPPAAPPAIHVEDVRGPAADVDALAPGMHAGGAPAADASVPDALVPDALVPDALVPDALVPAALVSDALLPDASPPGISTPASDQAPAEPVIDLPEVGAPAAAGSAPVVTSLEDPIGETIDIGLPVDSHAPQRPVLRVVADNTAVPPSFAELHARNREGVAPDLTLLSESGHSASMGTDVSDAPGAAPGIGDAAPAAAETRDITPVQADDEVWIGDVVLSEPLWRILGDEAQQHIAVLEHEVSLLQFDPDHTPLTPMLRASHTLCGIHRTGGIELTAGVAQCLEQVLTALERHGPPYPGRTQPVLARATATLAQLVARLRAREGFDARDEYETAELRAELEDLRQEVSIHTPEIDLLLGDDDAAHSPDRDGAADAASIPADDLIVPAPDSGDASEGDATAGYAPAWWTRTPDDAPVSGTGPVLP